VTGIRGVAGDVTDGLTVIFLIELYLRARSIGGVFAPGRSVGRSGTVDDDMAPWKGGAVAVHG
jgi:hypothetical protein